MNVFHLTFKIKKDIMKKSPSQPLIVQDVIINNSGFILSCAAKPTIK